MEAAPYNGRADLPEIASDLQFEIDELFPVAETLQMLRLAEIEGGDIHPHRSGPSVSSMPIRTSASGCSRGCSTAYVPLAAHIRRVLDERTSHTAPWSRFVDELEDHMSPDAADETLRAVISWARFGEVFAYDDEHSLFSLENPS